MQQIADWLEKLGMSEYGQRFAENRIDLLVLPDLTDQDLEKLGVVLGDRRKSLAIREVLVRINERPVRKLDGSRASLFHSLEKACLAPLPAERFDMSQWSRAKVNVDYHVAFDGNFYSVPYTLVQQVVEVRSTPTTVEIFHKGNRIASHLRSRRRGQAITQNEHRPKSHQAHLEWSPSRLIHWGETVGAATAEVIRTILASRPHPEMG